MPAHFQFKTTNPTLLDIGDNRPWQNLMALPWINPKWGSIASNAVLSKLKDKLWEEKSKGILTDIHVEEQGLSQTLSHERKLPSFFFLINLKPWWCKCSWGLHGLLGFFQLKGCSMMATTLLQTTSQQVIPTPPGKEGETTIEIVGSTTLRHLCSWKRPWKCKKMKLRVHEADRNKTLYIQKGLFKRWEINPCWSQKNLDCLGKRIPNTQMWVHPTAKTICYGPKRKHLASHRTLCLNLNSGCERGKK